MNVKKIKYIFKPKIVFHYLINKIFFNYYNPKYFIGLYNFSKQYVNFYQNDQNGDRETNGGWYWLKEYMTKEKPKVIFDVGGFDAEYSIEILKLDPNVELHIFEPDKNNFETKLVPAIKNKTKNIHLINKGLSDKEGKSTLYTNPNRMATNSLFQIKGGCYEHTDSITIDLSTVDKYAYENNINYIDFLKIDTEGNDLNVIKGSENMLKNNKIGTIQFEFSILCTYSHTYFIDFANYLSQFGYKIYKIMPQKVVFISNPEQERTQHAYFVAKK